MKLLTLNLNTALSWDRTEAAGAAAAGLGSAAEAMKTADTAPDSAEIAMVWDWDAAVDSGGDDGPRARRPLPAPAATASSGLRPAGKAHGSAGDGVMAGSKPETASLAGPANPDPAAGDGKVRLEPGRYLFAQLRMPADRGESAADDWLADAMDWFAREAWWTGAAAVGPLVVRLVREDGKTAVQPLRRLATPGRP